MYEKERDLIDAFLRGQVDRPGSSRVWVHWA